MGNKGTNDNPVGYVIRKMKSLSERVGMNIHAVCFYALWGRDLFARMMESVFEKEMGHDSISNFLYQLERDMARDTLCVMDRCISKQEILCFIHVPLLRMSYSCP
jgi:hypothetical protein